MERKVSTMKYKAFISYSHADRECAERLERELNTLAMSKGIQQFRIFRDTTYSKLNEEVSDGLVKNLEQSEWLIVICSPAVSIYKEINWVDFECNYFVNTLNRNENVICFISSGASFQEDISPFYPQSIKKHSNLLAADGRSEKDWFKNVVKVFYCILGNTDFEFEQDKDVFFLMEFEYTNRLRDSMDLFQKKKRWESLKKLSNIPYSAGVKAIEWYLMYAMESGIAYRNFCGYPQEKIGDQVIAFDYKNRYMCSSDSINLYVIDCKSIKVLQRAEAHGGKLFYYSVKPHQHQFVTWGKDFVLKIWNFDEGKLVLENSIQLQQTFYPCDPPVFAEFYVHEYNLVSLSNNTNDCAVITGKTLTIVDLFNMSQKSYDIPYRKISPTHTPKWNMLSFSAQGDIVALANDKTIYMWDLKENGVCRQYPRQNEWDVFRDRQIGVEYPVQIMNGGFWNCERCWSYYVDAQVICENNKHLLLSYEDKTLALWDMDSMDDEKENLFGRRLGRLSKEAPFDYMFQAICAVSSKWIVYTNSKKMAIRVCTREGKFVCERQVCDYDNVPLLPDEELHLPLVHSPMLKQLLNERNNPDWYTAVWMEFIDEDCLVVGCSKGKKFLWKIPEDEWNQADSVEGMELSNIYARGQDSYTTLNRRRKVAKDGNELVFSRIYDGKEIIRIPFPFEIKSFYFLEEDTVLILVSSVKIYRYEIPRIPDDADGYVEKLFADRREKYFT